MLFRSHPELGDQEFFSSEYLTGEIAKLGFEVEFPYMGIPTAFRCELGDGDGPAVCFLAEYDALPGYLITLCTSEYAFKSSGDSLQSWHNFSEFNIARSKSPTSINT